MANLPEANEYPAGIYQVETTDPVLGGPPNEATKAGLTNIPAMQLAKRTNWLKIRVDALVEKTVGATAIVAGLIRIATRAEAEDGVENNAAMTPLRTRQAIQNYLSSMNVHSIGAPVLARNETGSTANTSVLVAGTSLRASSVGGTGGIYMSGTYRCASVTPNNDIGLFYKVSL